MYQSGTTQRHADHWLCDVTIHDITTDDWCCVRLSTSDDSNWIGDGRGVEKMVMRGTRTG